MSPREFQAPWGSQVRWVTLFIGALLVLEPLVFLVILPTRARWGAVGMAGVLGLILVGSYVFTVRSFRLEGNELVIRRGWGKTRLSLAGLVSAQADPAAMRRSWRLAGNGGLFSITGWFRNRELGKYRAFVMDPANAVVLRFADRTVVVSPEHPRTFVREVEKRTGIGSREGMA